MIGSCGARAPGRRQRDQQDRAREPARAEPSAPVQSPPYDIPMAHARAVDSRLQSAPLMLWLSVAGALFLVWLVLVVLFTPGINYHLSRRMSVHDPGFLYTIQSTCQAALAPRQPRRDPHQRRARSTRRCSTRSAGRRARSSWSATSSSRERSPTSSSTRCRSARGTASTSRSSSTRSAASACGAGRSGACARPDAASSRTSGSGGTRSRASTTARTASS